MQLLGIFVNFFMITLTVAVNVRVINNFNMPILLTCWSELDDLGERWLDNEEVQKKKNSIKISIVAGKFSLKIKKNPEFSFSLFISNWMRKPYIPVPELPKTSRSMWISISMVVEHRNGATWTGQYKKTGFI